MTEVDAPARIALDANARNNAMHQELRLDRWRTVRDALWTVLDPLLEPGARVALVGGGSCDDVPLARIAERAARVDLVDFDTGSTDRARTRLDPTARERVTAIECDVTGGCADRVLAALRDGAPLPRSLPLPVTPLGSGDYDLVVGDMLYTQLLHAGLIALGIAGARQHELMRRYDPALTEALVRRVEASVAPGGHAVHVHDLACWASGHTQPLAIEAVLADPERTWDQLLRHDNCDPLLVLRRLGVEVLATSWWRWPFEPAKQFVVRCAVTRRADGSHQALLTQVSEKAVDGLPAASRSVAPK